MIRRLILLFGFTFAAAHGQNALYVDLEGEWRKSADDRPEYARPDFDDSPWQAVRLPWTAPPRRGVYWIRRKVELPAGADRSRLALTLGSLAEAYEIYVNGVLTGKAAGFSAAEARVARPATFDFPPVSGGPLFIAIRIWRNMPNRGTSIWFLYLPGHYALHYSGQPPPADGAAIIRAQQWRNLPELLFGGVELLLGLFAAAFWLSDRQQGRLLWMALYLLVDGVLAMSAVFLLSPEASPWIHEWRNIPLASVRVGLWAELMMAIFRINRWWVHGIVWLCCILSSIGRALESSEGFVRPLNVVYALIVVVIFAGWRGRVASQSRWVNHSLAALSMALAVITANRLGGQLGFATRPPAGEFVFSSGGAVAVLFSVLLFVILLRQLLSERQRLASELEAAGAVQQLLFPDARSGSVEAVYRPASEVGGDFWQDLPTADGKARVIAVGDVSGKGLKAAMIVSLLTGALRNRHSDSPAEILLELNRVAASAMHGGFVTAVVARVEPDRVVVANAGHPAPYLGGQEMPVPPGLPLGIDGESTYLEHTTPRSGQITFISDGVIEAANAKGELFGFERTSEIASKSAQEIAEAARAWGQNDDITVVTVRRVA